MVGLCYLLTWIALRFDQDVVAHGVLFHACPLFHWHALPWPLWHYKSSQAVRNKTQRGFRPQSSFLLIHPPPTTNIQPVELSLQSPIKLVLAGRWAEGSRGNLSLLEGNWSEFRYSWEISKVVFIFLLGWAKHWEALMLIIRGAWNPDALVSSCCYNRSPQIQWLKTIQICYLVVSGDQMSKQTP